MTEKEIKMYEIGYLLNPFIAEEKKDDEVVAIRSAIEGAKGLITDEGRPKMQKLAYEIKKPRTGKFEDAYFGWIKFVSEPEIIIEIKKSLDKNTNIIRFLTIELDKQGSSERKSQKPRIKRNPHASFTAAEPSIKTEVKTEEIDKKLEELLG